MSDRDLDKGGYGFQRVRTYLGPSLGWIDELVQPTVDITTGGVHVVQPGESLLLVEVAAGVTIQLPDVVKWMQQTAGQPATGFDRSITVKDIGGNAANFNIIIVPFGQQGIDNVQQATVISTAKAIMRFVPLLDLTGWAVQSNQGGGGSGGGGDVFKAGNNTFTGTNVFQGVVTVLTTPTADNSQNAASTAYVQNQGYITSVSLGPYALIASPTFTGDPKAPTPSPGDNDTSIATTAFVTAAIAAVGTPAPASAEYITSSASAALTAERVLTNTASITWDFTTPGQAKASTAAGGGNVSNSGSPVNGQFAQWTTPTTITGVSPAGVLTAIGAQPADGTLTGLAALNGAAGDVPYFTGTDTFALQGSTSFGRALLGQATGIAVCNYISAQPLDADLTAIAALGGTNTIYYRSAPDIWSPVTFSGLTFSGGILTVSGGGGNVSNVGTPTVNQIAQWTDATHIQGIPISSLGFAPLASPVFTGDPTAPTPATVDNDTSIATTAFVKAQAYAPLASPVFTGDPQAPTPATADNDTSIATTAFVKVQNYLSRTVTGLITVGYTFTPFNAGTFASGTFTPVPANGNYQYYTNTGAHTLAAPAADCAMDILLTQGSGAGAITFSGFTVGANVGDAITTTSTNKFIISIRRINAISTYTIKALQ